jgi:hypothetical protein
MQSTKTPGSKKSAAIAFFWLRAGRYTGLLPVKSYPVKLQ